MAPSVVSFFALLFSRQGACCTDWPHDKSKQCGISDKITVGFRHATLDLQNSRWGPARPRGWSPARHTELTGSQLRGGRRRKEEEGGGRRRKEEEGGGRRRKEEEGGVQEEEGGGRRSTGKETCIKSNDPHLTGGE